MVQLKLVLSALRLWGLVAELLLSKVRMLGLSQVRVEQHCVGVAGRHALVGLGVGGIVVWVHEKEILLMLLERPEYSEKWTLRLSRILGQ